MNTLKIIAIFALMCCTSCESLVDVPFDDINTEADIGLMQNDVNLTGDGSLIALVDIMPWITATIAIIVLAIACKNISIKGSYHIEAGDDPINE